MQMHPAKPEAGGKVSPLAVLLDREFLART